MTSKIRVQIFTIPGNPTLIFPEFTNSEIIESAIKEKFGKQESGKRHKWTAESFEFSENTEFESKIAHLKFDLSQRDREVVELRKKIRSLKTSLKNELARRYELEEICGEIDWKRNRPSTENLKRAIKEVEVTEETVILEDDE